MHKLQVSGDLIYPANRRGAMYRDARIGRGRARHGATGADSHATDSLADANEGASGGGNGFQGVISALGGAAYDLCAGRWGTG